MHFAGPFFDTTVRFGDRDSWCGKFSANKKAAPNFGAALISLLVADPAGPLNCYASSNS